MALSGNGLDLGVTTIDGMLGIAVNTGSKARCISLLDCRSAPPDGFVFPGRARMPRYDMFCRQQTSCGALLGKALIVVWNGSRCSSIAISMLRAFQNDGAPLLGRARRSRHAPSHAGHSMRP